MSGGGWSKTLLIYYNKTMENTETTGSLGKKIFFLHPSALTQNQIVSELAQEEYEVYVVKDLAKLRQGLAKYPDSVVFASINETMKESAWEELIRSIKGSPETASVDIGIIASSNNDDIKQKYEKFGLSCGYTVIKSDTNEAIKQLANVLDSVNAKGRRKFIRLIMEQGGKATVNIPMDGTFIDGVIKDISVVGFSCVFADTPPSGLKKNGLFRDIQLRLQTYLLKAEGIVFGARMEGPEPLYVLLFTKRVDPSVRTKIRSYIQTNLQNRLEEELKTL
jgi:hypothetical protein